MNRVIETSDILRRVVRITILAVTMSFALPSFTQEKAADSCTDCHRDPNFLVTNRKLYDYFQKWQESIHRHEGVSCADCHGGNPNVADKQGAHGRTLPGSEPTSAVNFQNVASTCGDCHADIYDAFRKSKHFEHVLAKGEQRQGPTCVTCHGSMNTAVVHVNTVEQTCRACHNDEAKNRPEVPHEAGDLLYRFLSIQRFYRYITTRGEPVETRAFLKETDRKIHALSETWHTFDLPKITADTETLLKSVKAKRQEVGKAYREKHGKPALNPNTSPPERRGPAQPR